MAQEEIKIKVTMTAGEAAAQMDALGDKATETEKAITGVNNSFVPLKKQIKDAALAAQEASARFGENSKQALEAAKKVAILTEEMSDFKQRIDSLNPEAKFTAVNKLASGIAGSFAAATGAMALFGAESEETQKALLKVQAAMAITQGLNEIKGLGDAMSNFKLIAIDAFKSLGKAIMANPLFTLVAVIGGVIAAFTTFMALNDDYATQINEQIALNNKKFAEEEAGLNRTLALARAKGEETIGIEKELLEATRNRIAEELRLEKLKYEKRLEYADNGLKAVGVFFGKAREKELREENDQAKKIVDLDKQLKQTELDIEVKGEEEKKKIRDQSLKDHEKHLADKKAAFEKQKAADAKLTQDLANEEKEINEMIENTKKIRVKNLEKELKALPVTAQEVNVQLLEQTLSFKEQLESVTTDIANFLNSTSGQVMNFGVDTISKNLDTIGVFMQAAEQNQLNAAKGNDAKQEQIRRKFFERNKKLQIAQTLMDTFASATAAFRSVVGIPVAGPFLAPIAAGTAVVAGLANVAKIRSMQYQGGGASSAGGGGGGGGLPSFNAGATTQGQQEPRTTQLDRDKIEQGQGQPIKVFVTETDISNKQNRVKMIQERATIK